MNTEENSGALDDKTLFELSRLIMEESVLNGPGVLSPRDLNAIIQEAFKKFAHDGGSIIDFAIPALRCLYPLDKTPRGIL
ncbi:MAG: hypothetical protein ACSHWN_04650 [Methylophilaceae bacterium]